MEQAEPNQILRVRDVEPVPKPELAFFAARLENADPSGPGSTAWLTVPGLRRANKGAVQKN